MSSITLPADLAAWAEAEVAAGRAETVSGLVSQVLSAHRRGVEALHRSLIEAEAEAERDGWISGGDFLAEIEATATALEIRAQRKGA
jgi:hypothetical protein